MPRRSPISDSPPAAVSEALELLGERIRTARLRRRLSQGEVAERVGVSRPVVAQIERGKPGTAVAAYLGVLWALGLLEQVDEVAHPDRDDEGRLLDRARAPKTARRRRDLNDDF